MALALRLIGALRQQYRVFLSHSKVLALRLQGANVGRGVKLYGALYIDGKVPNLTVGNQTVINHGVYINCRAPVHVGHRCSVSAGVKIISTGLDVSAEVKGRHIVGEIVIGDDVWIGSDAVVLSGVGICDRAVIGACSLVAKSITEPGVYVGIPARPVKNKASVVKLK